MKICVLEPDYGPSSVDYQYYDPHRDLTALLPGHTVDHVKLNKLTTYKQLKALSSKGYDIFVNLCEGYFEWEVPSIDVIENLERLGLPYTGPTPALYHVPKPVMKYVAYSAGVATPSHVLVSCDEQLAAAMKLRFPLFVKPSHAGDSLGVDDSSFVETPEALPDKVRAIVRDYGEALVEEYVAGREITVLVVAHPEEGRAADALTPVEYRFPEGTRFKTYALKTSELHPDANVPVTDPVLAARAKDAALRVFNTFGGVGYARMDFRLDAQGALYFLEINFTCSVFYADGYEGSADHVLKFDPMGQRGFAERIIAEGLARYRRKQRPYALRGNALSGYGIFATREIEMHGLVHRGEGRAHRIVSRKHTHAWSQADQELFGRYAYRLSGNVYAIWDEDPATWAPQNHSCDPNCRWDGLNVVAMRAIAKGEELTLDYGTFMDSSNEPFDCTCGSPKCRGRIVGSAGNSVVGG